MDKQVLLGLLEKPETITEDHLEELEDIVQKYPYFYLPYILIAKKLQENNSSLAPQKIRRASLYVYNRSLLKKYIVNGKALKTPEPMEENKPNEELSPRNLFNEIKQEIEDFDKKMETSSIEDLEKELATITESYLPKDYLTEETNKAEEGLNPEKTDVQKEQDFLIDEFLKADIFKKEKKETGETPLQKNQEESTLPEKLSITDEQISEEEAIRYFNEGNTQVAIEIYQQLKEKYPEKASYFQSQIDIFKMDFTNLEIKEEDIDSITESVEARKVDEIIVETTTEELLKETLEPILPTTSNTPEEVVDNTVQETVEQQKESEQVVSELQPDSSSLVSELTEEKQKTEQATSDSEVSEQQALAYFNEGNISKAVEIYKQLMLQNPEKKAYFASQIEILES
jgi:tetratricopeptide (TPR) repeat protein